MSHQKERQEKNCLNCNSEVHGRFCQVCGQENIETKESFWSLATHFVYDVTHFDGKFFSTLKYLLFRPGFLSQEYLRGRRTAYLHPIRMYVFTSAIFFLILFSFYQKASESIVKINGNQKTTVGLIKELEGKKKALIKSISFLPDTSKLSIDRVKIENRIIELDQGIQILKKDSTQRDKLASLYDSNNSFEFEEDDYKGAYNAKAYDSIQNSLPPSKRKNFFVARLQRQNLILKEKYGDETTKVVLDKFRHMFPQMLFVSLPMFALFLTLLYVRRKDLFYVNHVVFTIHLYCATFILILGSLWFGSILGWAHLKTEISNGIFSFLTMFYWYKAFRNFYAQSRKKTVLKYVLLIFLNIF
ncbi:MAG: hypothetical protein B7X72_11555, partial [Sphingobacteriia bacterium 39-39-8]